MTVVVCVAAGLALVVGTLLALDWYAAGRATRRMNVGAREQPVGETPVSRTRGSTEP